MIADEMWQRNRCHVPPVFHDNIRAKLHSLAAIDAARMLTDELIAGRPAKATGLPGTPALHPDPATHLADWRAEGRASAQAVDPDDPEMAMLLDAEIRPPCRPGRLSPPYPPSPSGLSRGSTRLRQHVVSTGVSAGPRGWP